ncbi:MAG: hypothetical protein AB7E37_04365 [Candidatus Altimarinota bacterium]
MKAFEILSTHTLGEGEKYDFFLFAPHAGYGENWIPFIQETLVKKDFSSQILSDYIRHEADLGTKELSVGIFEDLKKYRPDLKVLLILGEVPRAFCDLNRIPQRAIPTVVQRELWEDLNNTAMLEIENLISNAHYGLHLHTMNSKDNTISWNFSPDISENDVKYFLERGYSGVDRNDNILTQHVNGNYHSYQDLDSIFIKNWNTKNLLLDENVAYKFENHFSATHLVGKVPSSLIEITKGNLATEETKDSIDASKIILDEVKLHHYQELISQSIIEFFSQKNKECF